MYTRHTAHAHCPGCSRVLSTAKKNKKRINLFEYKFGIRLPAGFEPARKSIFWSQAAKCDKHPLFGSVINIAEFGGFAYSAAGSCKRHAIPSSDERALNAFLSALVWLRPNDKNGTRPRSEIMAAKARGPCRRQIRPNRPHWRPCSTLTPTAEHH
jgi:hypothetical protein